MKLSKSLTPLRRLTLFAVFAGAVATAFLWDDLSTLWAYVATDRSPPAAFIAALIFLPALGFPLSPLLVLLGVRFGWGPGLAVLAAVVPVHLAAAFWISRRLLHRRMLALAGRRGMDLSSLSRSGRIKAGILLMALPALSYTLKNHLLPLSGLSAGYCLAIGWPIQVLFGIPFVIFGTAASTWSLPLMTGAAVMIVLLAAAARPAARAFKQFTRSKKNHPNKKEDI